MMVLIIFPVGAVLKNLPADARAVGSIPGMGRSPGERTGNSLQYYCLEKPMPRGDWQAAVREVTASGTQLSMRAHLLSNLNYKSQN